MASIQNYYVRGEYKKKRFLGSVNGTAGGNGKHTTGFAVAVGDDPLNLTITNIGTFSSIQAPYGGKTGSFR